MFKKQVAATEPVTGTDLVRQALNGLNRKMNMASMAQDLGVPTATLEGFAAGRIATLSPGLMKKLVERLWHGHQTFNAEFDAIECTNKTLATSTGLITPPPDVAGWRYRVVHDPAAPPAYPKSVDPEPVKPPRTRPGWLGGFK